jgi:hypothetical protein
MSRRKTPEVSDTSFRFRLTPAELQSAKRVASRRGKTLSELVRDLLAELAADQSAPTPLPRARRR